MNIDKLESEIIEAERTIEKMQATIDTLAEAMGGMWPFIEEDIPCGCNSTAYTSAILQFQEALAAVKGEKP